MSLNLSKARSGEKLYMEVCRYYQELILSRKLPPGSKMPSLRKCAEELKLSRTTVENAYLQLAADGYIISRPQSGYYVTDIADLRTEPGHAHVDEVAYRYNFASSGVDPDSFRLDLWSRYMKSALRQSDRLAFYGEPRGEYDLRSVLSEYIRKQRNVMCDPDDIVIGAGMQSLLHILIPLLKDRHTVSFPTPSFVQGSTVFADYGFDVHYRDKDCDVVYVSPAHMTKWGSIMPTSRRLELIRYASEHGSLVIEDDFENEFVYLQRPTPSIFGLAGGKNVVYLGSFSRLLLPSIRLSFMVLPPPLAAQYRERAHYYNQTASKAEQIALCQFIRDGHLASQTRKLKRLYHQKLTRLQDAIYEVFGRDIPVEFGLAGTSLSVTLPWSGGGDAFIKEAQTRGLRIQVLSSDETTVKLILSCSAMPAADFLPACSLLKSLIASPEP